MSNNNPSVEELKAQIEALKAEQKKLQEEARKEFRIAVSAKGAVSVYGFGRFPVTLYKQVWESVLNTHRQEILDFIKANESKLATKSA